VTLRTVLQAVRHALGATGPDDKWTVYLAVDEAVRLAELGVTEAAAKPEVTDRAPRSGLEVVIAELAGVLIVPPPGLCFVPVLASPDVERMVEAFRFSFYHFAALPCPLLPLPVVVDILRASDLRVTGWETHGEFMRALSDMGGLMRAVELFVKKVEASAPAGGSIAAAAVNYVDAFHAVVVELNSRYGLPDSSVMYQLVRHAVLGLSVRRSDVVAEVAGKWVTWQELEGSGHVIIEPSGRVRLPFVHLYRLCEGLLKSPLKDWLKPLKLEAGDGIDTWQSWEQFNALFLATRLSLLAFDGTTLRPSVPASELFAGARCGDLSGIELPLPDRPFETAESAKQFTGDMMAKLTSMTTAKEIPWRNGGVVVRNGQSAPWADVFVYFPDSGPMLFHGFIGVECKYVEESRRFDYEDQFKKVKVAKNESLLFVLTTTASVADGAITLRRGCVLVSAKEFRSYFGPAFADRALLAACTSRLRAPAARMR
jgi:hypothetical protein